MYRLSLNNIFNLWEFIIIHCGVSIVDIDVFTLQVSYALYSACKYCVGEGAEGDKMPIFYQRLAGK